MPRNKASHRSPARSKKSTPLLEKNPYKDSPPKVDSQKYPGTLKGNDEQESEKSFSMVGIGASAGGLEAILQVLELLPDNTGFSYAIVVHFDPSHESLLPELLAKATKMTVRQVAANMAAEPNCVYVIPPNARLAINNRVFEILSRSPDNRGVHMPIDYFFRTLADDYKEKAIGIVLSGTSSDGTLGLQEIKSEGGITFAQTEETAKFSSMPRSAIHYGCVDYVYSPQQIAHELIRMSRHRPHGPNKESVGSKTSDEQAVREICLMLQGHSGVDYSQYKKNTIVRRIHRHMALHKKETLRDYVSYIEKNPHALEALSRDVPIVVTSFFRNPDSIESLKTKVFPLLLKNRKSEDPLRIWVPGCATGEEVYSIAIVLIEYLKSNGLSQAVQFFATDISVAALQRARSGHYIENVQLDISAERLKNFFVKVDNQYRVQKHIRDMCLFAKHDLTKDPPFSRLDLISCRNLLIYFSSPVQKRVFALFHYALKPQGFLSLGSSESIGQANELFAAHEKTSKIFVKKAVTSHFPFDFSNKYFENRSTEIQSPVVTSIRSPDFSVYREANHLIMNRYTPPSVVVNDDLEIIQVQGATGSFLELASGKASYNLLKMAKEGLTIHLRSAIQKARVSNTPAIKKNLPFQKNKHDHFFDLEVFPIKSPLGHERYFLVVFKEHPTQPKQKSSALNHKRGKGTLLSTHRLKQDLALAKRDLLETKEYLISVIDQQEAVNEELKSANEELLSTNEELQSASEEIETSKEELQSSNEELNTVNEELIHRNRDLSVLNSDLHHLLNGIQFPVVMLDNELRIRRYTPPAETFFKFISTDLGRLITDTKLNMDLPHLDQMIVQSIKEGKSKDQEIKSAEGKWYNLRIIPYKTIDNVAEGAMLALFDIHSIKLGFEAMKAGRNYLRAIVETVKEPLVVLDKKSIIKFANQVFYKTFNFTPESSIGKPIYQLISNEDTLSELKSLFHEILPSQIEFKEFILEHTFPEIGKKTLRISGRQIFEDGTSTETILLAIEDVSIAKRFDELKRSNEELKGFAFAASHDLQEPLRIIFNYLQLVKLKSQDKLEPQVLQSIEFAIQSAKRMKTLIDDLLAYARVGGTHKLNEVSVQKILDEVVEELKPAIEETKAKITYETLPTVCAEPEQLRQVFQNLISNSIKFRSKKTPLITISAEKKGNEWVIAVQDNAMGFEMAYADKIFDIFQRLHTADEYPGTGIGLAICKKIVESFRGSMWVQSEPDKGSTFFISLPTNEDE